MIFIYFIPFHCMDRNINLFVLIHKRIKTSIHKRGHAFLNIYKI